MRSRHIICECEDIPSGYPDPRDRDQEGTNRLPHPYCPVHREDDAENGVDYDDATMSQAFDLAYAHNIEEWVDEDRVDPETGDLYTTDPDYPKDQTNDQ